MDKYEEIKEKSDKILKETIEVMAARRAYEEEHNIRWHEDREMVAKVFGLLLQMTSNGGRGNFIKEMIFEKRDNGDEIVYPLLSNGSTNWYKINVTGDSGTAMIIDMTNQFVRKAW